MNQTFNRTIGAIALAGCALPALADSTYDDFKRMFTEGKASVDFRYRYEYVDDDALEDEANASTLRSRLTFASAPFMGFSFLGEFDDVSHIVENDYNSTANGKTQYPVVADPTGTDLNQAWLKYAFEDFSGTYGRQRILHGNQRFIGGVAWRQNEQTYDGFRAYYEGDMGLKVDLSYIDNVSRIFGPDDGAQPADLEGDNYFARVDWAFLENHNVAAFGYMLDIDNNTDFAPGISVGNATDTFGVEYSGKFGPFGAFVSYATQSDAGDNPQEYDADYYIAEGTLAMFGLTGTLGYEVLASDDGDAAFKTPYATLHKFQGWADKFLVTPADGIEDAYVGLAGALGPLKLAAFYHDFSAENSGGDYGTEIDLSATWPVTTEFSVQLKYADFDSDSDAYTDTYKTWMTLQFKI